MPFKKTRRDFRGVSALQVSYFYPTVLLLPLLLLIRTYLKSTARRDLRTPVLTVLLVQFRSSRTTHACSRQFEIDSSHCDPDWLS